MSDEIARRKELRQFGLLIGAVFTVIGLWPLVLRGEPIRFRAIEAGAGLILVASVVPSLLAPIHTGWMWVGHVLGWINTRILLGIVFYGLLTPIAIIFRLMGKSTMRHVFAERSSTYRVVRTPRHPSHMKYQF